ncbi:MAG: hypothetical protein H7838_07370 [Magnetococcus sp. DMHC-8]
MSKGKKDRRTRKASREQEQQMLREIGLLRFQSIAVMEDAYRSTFNIFLSAMRFLTPRLAKIRELKAGLRRRAVRGI